METAGENNGKRSREKKEACREAILVYKMEMNERKLSIIWGILTFIDPCAFNN